MARVFAKIESMSWDITIQDFPANAKKVTDIPDDFEPKAIGKRDTVIGNIQKVFPDADFSDPAWGNLDRPDFSIEFNIGDEEVCDGLMLHVRGGSGAVKAVDQLLKHLKLRGIDCQTGEFFPSKQPRKVLGSGESIATK